MTARLANTLGFVFAAIMVLAIATSPNIFGQQEKDSNPTWSFVFRVVDDQGVIIKDATIKTRVNKTSNSHVLLPNGDFRITFDSKPKFLSLRLKSEGKTPINVAWRENEIPKKSAGPFVVTLPNPSMS